MTADLVVFLRDRLAEDERLALAALPTRVIVVDTDAGGGWRSIATTRTDESDTAVRWAAGHGDRRPDRRPVL